MIDFIFSEGMFYFVVIWLLSVIVALEFVNLALTPTQSGRLMAAEDEIENLQGVVVDVVETIEHPLAHNYTDKRLRHRHAFTEVGSQNDWVCECGDRYLDGTPI